MNILEYIPFYRKEEMVKMALQRGISSTSWCLYVLAILLIVSCISYLYFERKRKLVNQLRMLQIQHRFERPPQKRRPGAVGREREIYQNILRTTHSYIYPEDENAKLVFRQTRSGTIYGKFVDKKENQIENI